MVAAYDFREVDETSEAGLSLSAHARGAALIFGGHISQQESSDEESEYLFGGEAIKIVYDDRRPQPRRKRSQKRGDNHDVESVERSSEVTTTEVVRDGQKKREEVEQGFQQTLPPVLLRMPNTAFGIALGLAGQSIMWKAAGTTFIQGIVDAKMINFLFWMAGAIVAMCVLTAYAVKAICNFEYIRDEIRNPGRIHFMNAPHLAMLMLTLAVPSEMEATVRSQQAVWWTGFIMQTCITQFVYEKWLFSKHANIRAAIPPFLLSTVGWFLLAVLGNNAQAGMEWGLNLPAYCFGAGIVLYLIVIIAVFNRLHTTPQEKGSPALFLMIAPPSVAVVALDQFDGNPEDFNIVAEVLLGWCLIMFIILLKIGPQISKNPAVLGAYWAFIFPLSALATATLRNSTMVGGTGADVFAGFFVFIATIALIVVFCRMALHGYQTWRRKAQWEDPLVTMRMSKDEQSGNGKKGINQVLKASSLRSIEMTADSTERRAHRIQNGRSGEIP